MEISASFLSIKDNLKDNIKKLVDTDIDYLHLDIMDGEFVPNKSWNIDEIKEIIDTRKPLDIHLMVEDVYEYIKQFRYLNPQYITFHVEVKHDIMELISYLTRLDIKVGLAIKPKTKVETLIPYLPFIDLVLIMSVKPGLGGQKFIDVTDKIDKLSKLKGSFKIAVDGGINDETIKKIKNADIAVVGSFITNGDMKENVKKLKESLYG